jgi:tetratricopeptide (TPR) repeat protein
MSDKTPQSNNRTERRRAQFGAAISGIAGIAFSAICAAGAVAADTGTAIPITGISVDAQRQLVVKFDNHSGGFPTVPHLLDLPGPNHRVVVDFSGATIEKGNVMAVEELSEAVMKVLPACKGVRYSNLTNAPKPTARIVIDLPEALHADPRVVKLEEGMVTIDLGDSVAAAQSSADPAAAASAAPAAADAPTPAAANTVEAAAASDTTAPAAPVPVAAADTADTAAAPATTTPAAAGGDDMASAPASQAKNANGSWDWSNGGAAPAAAPAAPAADATEQTAKAPSADSVDGVGAAPTQIAAQPGSAAELRPAIAAPAATSTDSSDQPVSSAAPPTPAVAAPPTETSHSSAQAALKLYNAAVKAHLSGKLADAISNYKGAIAANPQFAEAHSNLGLIYNQQHDYAGALSEFRKALAINPKDAITYNGIGAALRAQRDLPGAIKNWQTAVSLDPRLATAQYNLGTAYELQKDYDKALVSYQDAVKNDYRLGEAYYRMGLILSRKHEFEDAATQFKEALKVSGDAEYSADARAKLAALTKTTANTSTPK